MKGTRFSEEQIIGVLREHEAGASLLPVHDEAGSIRQPIFRSFKQPSSTLTQRRDTARHWLARPRLPVHSDMERPVKLNVFQSCSIAALFNKSREGGHQCISRSPLLWQQGGSA